MYIKKIRQAINLPYLKNYYFLIGPPGRGGTCPVSPPVSSMVVTCELLLLLVVVLLWLGHTNAQNIAIKNVNILVLF